MSENTRINIGKVAPIPKGNWDSTTTYEKLNMVNNGGVLYIAKDSVSTNTAITDTTKWMQATGKTLVGNVETVSYTTNASVTTTTSVDGNTILNFKLPRGMSGNDDLDDTAGIGDTDKVWSADKVDREIKKNVREGNEGVVHHAEGAIASFDDGADGIPVKDLKVTIEPVQDLHGYDNPWPAGGGKNLLPKITSTYINGVTTTVDENGMITLNGTASNTIIINTAFPEPLPSGNYSFAWFNSTSTPNDEVQLSLRNATSNLVSGSWNSAKLTNRTYSFTSAESAYYYRLQIDSGTSLTNFKFSPMLVSSSTAPTIYEPYTNICPISGFDEVNVTRTGKNLYHYDENNLEVVTTSAQTQRAILHTGLFGGKTYAISAYVIDPEVVTETNINIGKLKNGIATIIDAFITTSTITPHTETLTDGEELILMISSDSTYAANKNIPRYNYQIELGSTMTAYESPSRQTVTIDLPVNQDIAPDGIYYGGTVDILTGTMVVDRILWTGNTSTMNNSDDYPGWKNSGIESIVGHGVNTRLNGAFSNISGVVGSGTNDNYFACNTTGQLDTLYLPKNAWHNKTQTEWIADAIEVQIIVPLVQPLTVQLSPSTLNTLLSQNNIWSDTGDTSVDYVADTMTAIKRYHDPYKADPIECTTFGSITSFSDGSPAPVTALTVGIEPVQDLHGQANPYPAGGGKNKLDTSAVTWKKWHLQSNAFEPMVDSDTHVSYTINADESISITTTAGYYGIGIEITAVDYDRTASLKETVGGSIQFWSAYSSDATRLSTGTTSCQISANTSGFLAIRIDSATTKTAYIQIESGSTASSWSPYSNICPISGWTQANVTRTGKNLCPPIGFTHTGVTNDEGFVATYQTRLWSPMIPVKAGATYTAKIVGKSSQNENLTFNRWIGYNSSKTFVQRMSFGATTLQTVTATIPSGIAYIILDIRTSALTTNLSESDIDSIQLELGSTASDYVPYQVIQQVTIDLNNTRYGGYIDVLNGQIVVTHTINTLNGTQTITGNGIMPYGGLQIVYIPSPAKAYGYPTYGSDLLSNLFKTTDTASNDENAITGRTTNGNVVISMPASVTTKEQASTWFSNNNTQIWYKLAQPFTVPLTPKVLNTLKGQNHIWADTGDVSVTYRADTKLYIQKLTQPTEDDMTANNNIAANKFFMIGNTLYYSTQVIPTGTTIIPGSNCTQLSLADALNSLNS